MTEEEGVAVAAQYLEHGESYRRPTPCRPLRGVAVGQNIVDSSEAERHDARRENSE